MKILDLGIKPYSEVWELQKALVEKRAQDEIEDTLILVEHHPVYTAGRACFADQPGSVLPHSIPVRRLGEVPVVEIERGGKWTFHGPGQLVGYPIFKLMSRDLRKYLRGLERAIMDSLSVHAGLNAKPCPESLLLEPGQLQTGVWVGDRKIASIGIAVRRWVTYHGFALNFSTDLRYFEAVDPCGFNASVMTTLANEIKSSDQSRIQDLSLRIKKDLAQRLEKLSEQGLKESTSIASSLI